MAYIHAYAANIIDGRVRSIIVIPYMDDDDDKITGYCNSIGLSGIWVDTSWTGSRRGKYASPGDLWDGENFTFPPVPEPLPVIE